MSDKEKFYVVLRYEPDSKRIWLGYPADGSMGIGMVMAAYIMGHYGRRVSSAFDVFWPEFMAHTTPLTNAGAKKAGFTGVNGVKNFVKSKLRATYGSDLEIVWLNGATEETCRQLLEQYAVALNVKTSSERAWLRETIRETMLNSN